MLLLHAASAIRGASRACRQLLKTCQSNQSRLNLHILQSQVVVWQIKSLADHNATLLSSLVRCQSFVLYLLSSVLVLQARCYRHIASLLVHFLSLLPQFLRKLVNLVLQRFAEVLESDDHHCDVVHRLLCDSGFEDLLDGVAAVLMDGLPPVGELLFRSLPASLDNLRVVELVVDSIAAKHDVVVVILDFEALDVWRGYHNFRISEILGPLGLNITKSARYGKPSREDSMRPKQYLLAHDTRLSVLVLDLGHGLSLVDLATRSDDSLVLILIIRFVIP